jgi:ribosomal-protein-alanine N-acetyltransferase
MPAKRANQNRPAARPRVPRTALRDYTYLDFVALYDLDQVCYPRGIAYSKRELRWFLSQAGALCIVAEIGSAIAGFLIADRENHVAHIITIDVAPAYRRRGVGTQMIREIERRLAALGVNEINLETAANSEAGTGFWLRHGYRTIGVMPGYYLGRQDALAMQKLLPDSRE